MINFQEVSKQYYSDLALDSVTFAIEKGDFVFLVGPTGSGKTTIFRLIIRDLLPTAGSITIGDIDVIKLPQKKVRHLRRNVGVVFQDLKLLHDRTVGENVMLPLQLSGISEKDAKKKAEEVLGSVGLDGTFDKFPQQLSGGQKQRVAIARALIFDPEVILADEPTGNLDMQTSLQILELLESINKKGTTIFMATHNDRIIDATKRRIIVLEEGKLKEDRKLKEAVSKHEVSHTEKHVDEKKHTDEKKKIEPEKSGKNEEKVTLESLVKK
jgi:cell division transport system ATP-binding protein